MANRNKDVTVEFNALSFLWRFLGTLALVLLTFNPSGTSAYHWVSTAIGEGTFGPIHLIAIVVLLIGWVVVWIATQRSMDTLGVVLASVLLAGVVWLLIDTGILAAGSVSAVTWIVLICLAIILAIGMSWGHVWRRLTGQVSVDQVED